ncbi:ankyrin repeat domain-containing protein [Catellatospora sichuanensis]|uniref:ankyrin repeat domain-containing protein n=1 Tax=Catellatospora sichuanensis TaxID=1969805 RepID=UPI001642D36C|nr:ankyrin repeat domain-containing protein [Catellatospora sichuanensis]
MAEVGGDLLGRMLLHHPARSTVAECARLREAGDWAGACRVAGLTPDVDLVEVEVAYGAAAALRIRAALAQLAPDLLRSYLPTDFRNSPSWPGYVVLTDLAAAPDRVEASPVRLPAEPVLALTPPGSAQERRGAHLAVVAPDRLPVYWRALPVWCWRADAVTARAEAYASEQPQTEADRWALRTGAVTAHDLHPLVFAALHPGTVQVPAEQAWEFPAVRVRCASVWHEMQVRDGRLVAMAHTEAEIQRELALGALGGPVQGCAAVLRGWHTGHGRLPRALRPQRDRLFRCARAGRTDLVLSMLDAGFDPAVVGTGGVTLLHLLARLDHERLLPRLLAAGLPVNGRDKEGGTPLHHAERAQADDVVAALHEAGADPGLTDRFGRLPSALRPTPRYDQVAEVRATPLPSFFRRLRALRRTRAEERSTTLTRRAGP